MVLNSQLIDRIGRGEFVSTTPVIIETQPSSLNGIISQVSGSGEGIQLTIPTFNMVSGRFQNGMIRALEDDPRVVAIYFDDVVPVPNPIAVSGGPDLSLRGILSLVPLSRFGVPSIPGKPLVRLGLRPRDLAAQLQFALSRVRPAATPDPGWIPTSQLRTILGADVARSDGIEGRGVMVAALDTGIPAPIVILRQPQLRGRIQRFGLFFIPQPDRSGHGTLVVTIIGGLPWEARNGFLLEGIAPEVILSSVKVLQTRFGIGRTSQIIKGIEVADTWGAKIINMSLGSEEWVPDNPYEPVFQQLIQKNTIFVVAAGNMGPNAQTMGTPGGSPRAWSVGSVNLQGQPAGFSSRGPAGQIVKPDLTSPGGDDITGEAIYSTTSIGSMMDKTDGRRADGLAAGVGTSFSAPGITGLFALWEEWLQTNRNRTLTNADIATVLARGGGTPNNSVGVGTPHFNWVKVL